MGARDLVMTNTKPRIGYVGVGLMGAPMTLRLLAAGYEVVVWNRTREKILPVLEAGATEAENPANVTSQVDFVFQCLTDAQAVEQVVFGDEGIKLRVRLQRGAGLDLVFNEGFEGILREDFPREADTGAELLPSCASPQGGRDPEFRLT